MTISFMNMLVILLAISSANCKFESSELKIYADPLVIQINHSMYDTVPHSSKFMYYLIENYSSGVRSDSLVDEFTCTLLDSIKYYDDFYITYLRKSQRTNFENLKENPKDLDRYSIGKDLLYDYSWTKRGFLSKQIYDLKPVPLVVYRLKCWN